MGSFLDRPKIDKFNNSGNGKNINQHFKYAVASMQGWRADMEDAHHIVVPLWNQHPFCNWSFFAVFDGHAGSKVAELSANHLLETLLSTDEFNEVAKEMSDGSIKMNDKVKNLIKEGISKGFMIFDENMQRKNAEKVKERDKERSGTTVVCAILTPEYIFFANLGDSRGILCSKNSLPFVTEDHKPYKDKERERINNAGGSVLIQRVNGQLAVSRALGDFEYKSVPNLPRNEQVISPEPDIYIIPRNPSEDEFLVLACDGIFDVLENYRLCELVRLRLQVKSDLAEITNEVLDSCLSRGSRDNMTIILVVFEAAPKPDPVAIEEDKKWTAMVENKLLSLLKEMETGSRRTADILSNLLKRDKKLLLNDTTIHLARHIIHRILDDREKKLNENSLDPQETTTKLSSDLDELGSSDPEVSKSSIPLNNDSAKKAEKVLTEKGKTVREEPGSDSDVL